MNPGNAARTPRSIWLVGLSGSGKSAVGPVLARRLGYDFVDLDRRIESVSGETISKLFRAGGEGSFRRLEAVVTAEVADAANVVVATGGGWMARDDIERDAPGRIRIWLRVSPATAIDRLRLQSGSGTAGGRPLLAGADPEASLAKLLASRESAYAEAELQVLTDRRKPEEVVAAAVRGLRQLASASRIA